MQQYMQACESADRGRILKVLSELTDRTGFDSDLQTVDEAIRYRANDPESLKNLYRRLYDDVPVLQPVETKADISLGDIIHLNTNLYVLDSAQILILDEFGYVPYDRAGSELLSDYLSSIHEQKPVILNTNLEFSQWVNVLYDIRMTTALIGMLTYHVEIILFPGGNNRIWEYIMNERMIRTSQVRGTWFLRLVM